MRNQLAAWIVLGLVAIVCATSLGIVNELTKDKIVEQEELAAEQNRLALVPDAVFERLEPPDDGSVNALYAGLRDDEPVGYVAQAEIAGYGGKIEVTVGTDVEGVISGIMVGGRNFAETPGLGAKAKEPAFTDQFKGVTVPVAIGEQVDALTAATITSNAVVRGVNDAVRAIAEVAGFSIEGGPSGGALSEGRYSGTAEGFGGPVYVEIQLDSAGVIQDIAIGNEAFNETPGYGQKALEPAFYTQFLGKSGSVALGVDIDAISGATITSTAVVDAVNSALHYADDPEAAAAAMAATEPEKPETTIPDMEGLRAATGYGVGFAQDGKIAASITIDADDKIVAITIGDDSFADTPAIGGKVLEPSFAEQFIGKTLPLGEGDIDIITGATFSVNGAIDAVNNAFALLSGVEDPAPGAEDPISTPEAEVTERLRTATGYGVGFAQDGKIAASIAVDENDKIVAITIGDDSFADTPAIGGKVLEPSFAEQFIGKTLPLGEGDIDMITGATFSVNGAIEAVNNAFALLSGVEDPAPETEDPTPEAETMDGLRAATGYGVGFAQDGKIAASITIDADDKIVAITIGDDAFADTPAIGGKVLEPSFAEQFIGKTLPLGEGDIDMITGATFSVNGAIDAANNAFVLLSEAEIPAPEESEPPQIAPPGTAGAYIQGFASPVFVQITVGGDGTITDIGIGDERFQETDGFGAKALEKEFAEQFKGMTPPIVFEEIDAISGATITTQAVVRAINAAYQKLLMQQ